MSRFTPEFEELVDLFCEEDMTAEQAARLEALAAESAEIAEVPGGFLPDPLRIGVGIRSKGRKLG